MYRHLLIATDGSELANNAVAHGLALAKAVGAKVTAVTVTEPFPAFAIGDASVALPIQEYEEAASSSAANILGEVSAAAKMKGVACEVVHVNDQLPAQGIVQTAKATGSDLIVMASHGRRGLSKLVLGSQANEVVSQTAVPVLICR
jgi:nucleotide-binding universal stress UspA family protein